jgi:hypothetical protein
MNNSYDLDSPESGGHVGATDLLVNLGPVQPGLFQEEEVYQREEEILVEGDFQDVVLCPLVFLSFYSYCINISFSLSPCLAMSIDKTCEVISVLKESPSESRIQ